MRNRTLDEKIETLTEQLDTTVTQLEKTMQQRITQATENWISQLNTRLDEILDTMKTALSEASTALQDQNLSEIQKSTLTATIELMPRACDIAYEHFRGLLVKEMKKDHGEIMKDLNRHFQTHLFETFEKQVQNRGQSLKIIVERLYNQKVLEIEQKEQELSQSFVSSLEIKAQTFTSAKDLVEQILQATFQAGEDMNSEIGKVALLFKNLISEARREAQKQQKQQKKAKHYAQLSQSEDSDLNTEEESARATPTKKKKPHIGVHQSYLQSPAPVVHNHFGTTYQVGDNSGALGSHIGSFQTGHFEDRSTQQQNCGNVQSTQVDNHQNNAHLTSGSHNAQ